MARICAFVMNPVTRDARVTKQAASLAAQGHEVTVIGLADNNFPEEQATLESGVRILRVPRMGSARSSIYGAVVAKLIRHVAAIPREARRRDLHLLLLPALMVYVAAIGLFGSLEQRAERLLELTVYALLAGGVFYLLVNLRRVVHAILFLVGFFVRRISGRMAMQRLRARLVDVLKRLAPRYFEEEVVRRMRVRAEQMVEIAGRLAPDLVHCHDVHTLPVGARMKKLTGCRVVYDAHEIYEEIAQSSPQASARYRALHRRFLPFADGFVTINDSIAAWYKDNYPRIPEPAVVMNATPRTPRFDYDGRLHEAAGLAPDDKILLYQGGFATKRGLEYVVEAAAFLPPDWTLVMMGWGRLESTLMGIGERVNAACTETRSGDAVRFLPPVPQADLPYWSAGATLGVIPYDNVGLNHWFCTPNKLWEYPNANVPVLVSPFPELRKPVEAYGYGWLLPEEQDPRQFAELVASLPEHEIARARAACMTFSDAENWSKYEVRLLDLYDRLLGGAQGSSTIAPSAVAGGRAAAE